MSNLKHDFIFKIINDFNNISEKLEKCQIEEENALEDFENLKYKKIDDNYLKNHFKKYSEYMNKRREYNAYVSIFKNKENDILNMLYMYTEGIENNRERIKELFDTDSDILLFLIKKLLGGKTNGN